MVADTEVDMVADMEVDEVADMLTVKVADKKKKKSTSTLTWKSNLVRELVTGVG